MYSVITTIQTPTPSVLTLVERLGEVQAKLIAVGDKKGPASFDVPRAKFFSIHDQRELALNLAGSLPVGHYARKNLGYLVAFGEGANSIYETDDDNAPNAAWRPRALETLVRKVAPRKWVNVYRMFSSENIWPRGFPLELISDAATYHEDPSATELELVDCPIQQGLANVAPDVDAVWRLTMDREFDFSDGPSRWLPPGSWCPFNSQTTWWWPVAYPLMYLPSYCSFRMTDIWRSFVAQRCLWEMGYGMVFHAAEADQQRNVHNLLRDFEDEISGYLQNQKIVNALEAVSLKSNPAEAGNNLRVCYEALVRLGVIPAKELALIDHWLEDVALVLKLREADRKPALAAKAAAVGA